MPRQPADCQDQRSFGSRAAGLSRFAPAAVPELHRVPSEDSRKPRGPESAEMRTLLFIASLLPLAAQQTTPPASADAKPAEKPAATSDAKPDANGQPAAPADSKPAAKADAK